MNTPTAHNAAKLGDIAPTVLMPGDPLRAAFIAETFLENVVQYNHVRGMNGYTGTYQGKRVSVQGHGMGGPSIGIYSYELYNFYDVQRIIRIGSSGGIQPHLHLGDIVVAMGACTDSAYAAQYGLPGTFAPIASYPLLAACVEAAKKKELCVHVGNILSSDIFYSDDPNALEKWVKMGVLAAEMEAMALYCNSARAQKESLCITTVSDLPFTGEAMPAKEREQGFSNMVELALAIV